MSTAMFDYMDNNQLLSFWCDVEQREMDARDYKERIDYEIQRRMRADGATVIAHPLVTCELKAPSPTYDQTALRQLLEIEGIPPEEMAKGFLPAHWSEPTWVEDKWNMVKIKPLVKYGDAVAKVIATATIKGTPRLKITRKEA